MMMRHSELQHSILSAFPNVHIEFGTVPDEPGCTTVEVYGARRESAREIKDIIYAYVMEQDIYGFIPMMVDLKTTKEYYPEIADKILAKTVFQFLDRDPSKRVAFPIEEAESVPLEDGWAA